MFVPGLGGIIFFECSEYFPLLGGPPKSPGLEAVLGRAIHF